MINEADEDDPKPIYGVSAYVQAFDDTITFALEKNGNLWTAHESTQLYLCRPENLHEGARLLLSRLSLRKAKWMKSSSISHYVLYKGRNLTNTTDSDGGLLRSVETLKQHSFLEILQSSSSFELAFEAVQSCFLLDDLTRLYKRLTSNKNATSNNKNMSKEELLNAIHHAARTQRTLFGHSLSHKFASAVLEVMKEASAGSFWNNRSSTDNSNNVRTPYKSNNQSDPNMVLLRINPEILHLLRRCQRLYQISCNAGSSGYSNTTTTTSTGINYNATGAAAAKNTSAATTGFASVLTPLEFNAPLLVIFNKTRYPDCIQQCLCSELSKMSVNTSDTHNNNTYSMSSSSSTSGNNSSIIMQQSNVFRSQRSFLQWEGAVELHAACLDQGIQELLLHSRGTEKLQTLIESFQSDEFLHTLQTTNHNSSMESMLLYELARLCGLTQVYCADTENNANAAIEDNGPTSEQAVSLSTTNNEPIITTSTTKRKSNTSSSTANKSRASNTTIDLSCLSSAHLLAVLCMLSYAYKNKCCGSGGLVNTNGIAVEGDANFADHMLKFDAGTQLAYACSDAATAAEKEPYRQYTFAILLFELLLALPYLPHRRGYYYKRLCIDYSHLQLHRCALRACYRCLSDPVVNVSDKTDLASRATALKQKILKQHTTATSTGKKNNSRTNNNESIKSESMSSDNREWGVYAVERDFIGILSSITLDTTQSTNNIAASAPADPTLNNINSDETDKIKRSSRSSRVTTKNEELSTTIKTEDISAILMSDSAQDKTTSVLPVLCLINIIPMEMSSQPNITTTTTRIHSVLDVLYNALLREIVRSPHTTSAATTTSYSSTTTKIEAATIVTTAFHNTAFALTTQEQNSELKKRKLSTTTTTSNTTSKLSQSHTINGTSSSNNNTKAWACTVCTFLNTTERFCSMCMTARVTTAPKPTNTGVNNSSSKPIRSATTNSLVSFIKTTTTSTKVANNSVVDLVSSDDDDEVEIIDILTPTLTRPVDNLFKQETTVATITNESSTTNSNNKASLSNNNTPVHREGNAKLAAVQAQLYTIYTTMQQYLQSLVLFRRTTSTANTTYLPVSLYYELNLCEGSTEGEEEDDLLLLGLLLTKRSIENSTVHSITIKEDAPLIVDAASNNSRPSLEDLIPAPPFFVVTGKRTGDPASRKGKSKFCGLNDELVNVETYVQQKCHFIDPDDCTEEVYNSTNEVIVDSSSNDSSGATMDTPMDNVEEDASNNVSPTVINKRRSTRAKATMLSDPTEDLTITTTTTTTTTSSSLSINATLNKSAPTDKKAARRVPYTLAIDNGGWQGWHCEGSIFKTLFGLLMWDVLFSCPLCSNRGDNSRSNCNTSCSNSSASNNGASNNTTCSTRNPSTYCVFVTPFQDAPLDLGHRSFYRTRRVAIQNRIAEIASFSTHQLITALGTVYRKHYGENCRGVQWGVSLPLLQLMAVCMRSSTVAAVCNALSVNYKHFTGGAPDLMLVRIQRRVVRTDSTIHTNINTGNCVGEDGSSGEADATTKTATVYPVTEFAIVPVQDILGQDWESQLYQPVVLPRRSTAINSVQAGLPTNNMEYGASEMMDVEEEEGEESGDVVVGGDNNLCSLDEDSEGDNIAVEMPVSNTIHAASISAMNNADDTNGEQEEPNAHMIDLFLPHLAPTPDIEYVDANRVNSEVSDVHTHGTQRGTPSYTYEYKLEARFIEVKGPTDSLMFRQRVWLHILNSAVGSGNSDSVLNYTAYVCHVKEE